MEWEAGSLVQQRSPAAATSPPRRRYPRRLPRRLPSHPHPPSLQRKCRCCTARVLVFVVALVCHDHVCVVHVGCVAVGVVSRTPARLCVAISLGLRALCHRVFSSTLFRQPFDD
jgi:hypothetical protein